MKIELIDHMGSDLTVVNAARVSFNKKSDWVYCCGEFCTDRCKTTGEKCPRLSERDQKLIRYLAEHNHWTPFAHCIATFYFKVPIFVARQLHKHQVGFVVNEVSRRYVDEEPEFFFPKKWRKRSKNKKQGSSGETIDLWKINAAGNINLFAFSMMDDILEQCRYSKELYNRLIYLGVAPEQARMILPLNTYTEFYMTGSLAAWARMYRLRVSDDAQEETKEVVEEIGNHMKELFPYSWKVLINE